MAQISDLYSNEGPANLYAVVHHGYPLHWVTTTNPIPLELLDPELFVSPLFLANFASVVSLLPIFSNLFLNVSHPLFCAVITNPISLESIGSNMRVYQGMVEGYRFIPVNFILGTLFYTGIYSISSVPLLAVIVYREKETKWSCSYSFVKYTLSTLWDAFMFKCKKEGSCGGCHRFGC